MEKGFKAVKGGVSAPRGFFCGAVAAGVKKPNSRRKDLALIYSKAPAVGAGVFTSNRVKAAPVKLSAQHLGSPHTQAIIANSGNANACTGPAGIEDTKRMVSETAAALGIDCREVVVCSTGIIGVPMPIERICSKIPALVRSASGTGGSGVARAIMTSDTRPKEVSLSFKIGGSVVKIGGTAKGAGMIRPDMATMLCFITTDACIGKKALQNATLECTEQSFNRISVDGDMSTNDSVIVLANGLAGNREIQERTAAGRKFNKALGWVMFELAKKIVKDGERVTKFVEIAVRGARTLEDAKRVAEAVANSTLVKCSWNGSDPNWGRVMHAIGYAGARIREEMIDIYFDGLRACEHGMAADTPFDRLQSVVKKDSFRVGIDLNSGGGVYSVYTSDLSPEYVDFNRAEYSLGSRI